MIVGDYTWYDFVQCEYCQQFPGVTSGSLYRRVVLGRNVTEEGDYGLYAAFMNPLEQPATCVASKPRVHASWHREDRGCPGSPRPRGARTPHKTVRTKLTAGARWSEVNLEWAARRMRTALNGSRLCSSCEA